MRTVILYFLSLLSYVAPLNVLFSSFHDSGSHQGSMSKLFIKLAKSGHNITVLDTTSKKGLPDYGFPNIHLADLRCGEDYSKKLNVPQMWWETTLSCMSYYGLYKMGDLFLNDVFREKSHILPQVLATDFDVIVIDDLFSVHGIYISEFLYRKRKTPIIQYGTTFQVGPLQSARAHGHSFFNDPAGAGPFPRDISDIFNPRKFASRFINFYTKFTEAYIISALSEFGMKTLNKHSEEKFSFQDHYSKSALVLTEAFWGLGLPISQGNDFHPVGAHCPKIGTLDKEIEEFISDPKSKGESDC